MSGTVINLYEPTDPPEVPRKRVGRATLSMDTWEKIGGVGSYADYKPMKMFRLYLREPMPEVMSMPYRYVEETITMHTVLCEAVPIWEKGRYTFEWRAVVPSKEDRDKIASFKGEWYG
jgi:hypothetical protein